MERGREGENRYLTNIIYIFIYYLLFINIASVVFIDKCNCWSAGRRRNAILENQSFLAASMALASGVLLFSSLAVLLPASRQRLSSSKSYLLYLCFFGGALFTLGLTKVIHALTPDAIHACGGPPSSPCDMEHDSALSSPEEEGNLYDDDEESTVPGSSEHSHYRQQHHDDNNGEHQPIITKSSSQQLHGHDYGSTNHHHSHHHPHLFREAHFRFHPHHHHEHGNEHSDEHHDHNAHNQYESQSQKSDLLRIGIQTAVAIGVHKFPGNEKKKKGG